MSEILDVEKLKKYLEEYAKERDWEQFHNPKNLAMAMAVETSELLEIFQWLTPEQALKFKHEGENKEKVAHELADIMTYLILISKYLDINLPEAIERKLKHNAEKYPVDKARGNAKKYNEF